MAYTDITEKYPQRYATFSTEIPIDTRIDEVDDSGAVTYVGITYKRSAAGSEAVWRIKRIKKVGYVSNVGYAADAEFTQVWDNRAGLTYSQGG
jgi:hypothetical protein